MPAHQYYFLLTESTTGKGSSFSFIWLISLEFCISLHPRPLCHFINYFINTPKFKLSIKYFIKLHSFTMTVQMLPVCESDSFLHRLISRGYQCHKSLGGWVLFGRKPWLSLFRKQQLYYPANISFLGVYTAPPPHWLKWVTRLKCICWQAAVADTKAWVGVSF